MNRSIEWSVRLLSEVEATVHARLSVLPGVFTTEAAVAVAGDGPVPVGQVPDLLQQLLNRSLLAAVAPVQAGQPTRFRQLATVRAHAERSLAATGQAQEAGERRQVWLRDLLDARPPLGKPDTGGWYQRVDDNHDSVVAELSQHLVDRPSRLGVRMAAQLSGYWGYRNRSLEGEDWNGRALSQPNADPADRFEAQISLASLLAVRTRTDLSSALLRDVVTGTTRGDEVLAVGGLTTAAFIFRTRQEPLTFVEEEVRRRVAASDEPVVKLCGHIIDLFAALPTRDPEEVTHQAAELMEQALALGEPGVASMFAGVQVMCRLMVQDGPGAAVEMDRMVSLYFTLGATMNPILAELQGNVSLLAGDLHGGVQRMGAARAAAFRAGAAWPSSPMTQPSLAAARQYLTTAEFERAWRAGEASSLAG